jgi:prepilin-type processing-associated H-X9-DG protein
MSIILLLMAILLPAVGRTRAAALRIQCASNLRQMAHGAHAYHDTHGMLPPWIHFGKPAALNSYQSVHSLLLPYVDGSNVYEALNFGVRMVRAPLPSSWPEQRTAASVRVSVFLCPADGATRRWAAPVSYRGCIGPGTRERRTAEYIDGNQGMFSGPAGYAVTFANATDGMQATALFSERLVGDGAEDASGNPARTILATPGDFIITNAERARRGCEALSQIPSATRRGYAGRYWLFTGIDYTLYSHAMGPNTAIPDCQNGSSVPHGTSTARAHHGGVVNVAFADASVRAVSSGVDLAVWRALATRDGAETVLNSSF